MRLGLLKLIKAREDVRHVESVSWTTKDRNMGK